MTVRCPAAAALANVPDCAMHSSSGWAWNATRVAIPGDAIGRWCSSRASARGSVTPLRSLSVVPQPDDTTDAIATEPDDPRLAFVYQEGLRGLLQQQAAVESMHNRAATLIFAAAFASSLLGGPALADGLNGGWEWLGVILLL